MLIDGHSGSIRLLLRARSCSEFFQPVQLNLQLSGLAVEFFSESFFGSMAFFPLVRKNLGQFCHGLLLPADDLVAMHSELGSDLIDRHFSPDGGQSDLGLEVGTEFCSSGAHGSSFLFLGSPLILLPYCLVHF